MSFIKLSSCLRYFKAVTVTLLAVSPLFDLGQAKACGFLQFKRLSLIFNGKIWVSKMEEMRLSWKAFSAL